MSNTFIETFVCAKCGNRKTFIGTIERTYTFEETDRIDQYGNYVESIERDEIEDSYDATTYKNIYCDVCKSDEVLMFDKPNRLTEFLYEHTKKDGSWSWDELPEEERDFKILEDSFLKQLGESK